MNDQYDDIIHLPHYEPKHHPRMPMSSRAAQFAPFAALTGYGDAIQESGRLTEEWIDRGEFDNEELNRKIEMLLSIISRHPTIAVEYFLPDSRKAGGSYQTHTGQVKCIDDYEKAIVMTDGKRIALEMVANIDLLP